MTETQAGLSAAKARQQRQALRWASACERFRVATNTALPAAALRRLLVSQRIGALRAMFFQIGVDEAMEPIEY